MKTVFTSNYSYGCQETSEQSTNSTNGSSSCNANMNIGRE